MGRFSEGTDGGRAQSRHRDTRARTLTRGNLANRGFINDILMNYIILLIVRANLALAGVGGAATEEKMTGAVTAIR